MSSQKTEKEVFFSCWKNEYYYIVDSNLNFTDSEINAILNYVVKVINGHCEYRYNKDYGDPRFYIVPNRNYEELRMTSIILSLFVSYFNEKFNK